jgi:hypothetical protein
LTTRFLLLIWSSEISWQSFQNTFGILLVYVRNTFKIRPEYIRNMTGHELEKKGINPITVSTFQCNSSHNLRASKQPHCCPSPCYKHCDHSYAPLENTRTGSFKLPKIPPAWNQLNRLTNASHKTTFPQLPLWSDSLELCAVEFSPFWGDFSENGQVKCCYLNRVSKFVCQSDHPGELFLLQNIKKNRMRTQKNAWEFKMTLNLCPGLSVGVIVRRMTISVAKITFCCDDSPQLCLKIVNCHACLLLPGWQFAIVPVTSQFKMA